MTQVWAPFHGRAFDARARGLPRPSSGISTRKRQLIAYATAFGVKVLEADGRRMSVSPKWFAALMAGFVLAPTLKALVHQARSARGRPLIVGRNSVVAIQSFAKDAA